MSMDYWEVEAEKYRKTVESVLHVPTKVEMLWPHGECGRPLFVASPVNPAPVVPKSLFDADELEASNQP